MSGIFDAVVIGALVTKGLPALFDILMSFFAKLI